LVVEEAEDLKIGPNRVVSPVEGTNGIRAVWAETEIPETSNKSIRNTLLRSPETLLR
jgi:hypothetical protein